MNPYTLASIHLGIPEDELIKQIAKSEAKRKDKDEEDFPFVLFACFALAGGA